MKRTKTTIKDLEIKIAVINTTFKDITRRLDMIELNIEKLSAIINKGMGAWKGLLFLASLAGTAATLIKI